MECPSLPRASEGSVRLLHTFMPNCYPVIKHAIVDSCWEKRGLFPLLSPLWLLVFGCNLVFTLCSASTLRFRVLRCPSAHCRLHICGWPGAMKGNCHSPLIFHRTAISPLRAAFLVNSEHCNDPQAASATIHHTVFDVTQMTHLTHSNV